jgi:hypothetical protein
MKLRTVLEAIVVIAVITIAVTNVFPVTEEQSPKLAGLMGDLCSTTTSSVKSAGVSVTQPLASDANRRYLGIQSQSANQIFFLLEGNMTAASSAVTSTQGFSVGYRLAATSTSNQGALYEIYGYTGVVNWTSAANATATITTCP